MIISGLLTNVVIQYNDVLFRGSHCPLNDFTSHCYDLQPDLAFTSLLWSCSRKVMTHLKLSTKLQVLNNARNRKAMQRDVAECSQISATLHPTGERREPRWSESRSEGGSFT